jgi:hypothetical protein
MVGQDAPDLTRLDPPPSSDIRCERGGDGVRLAFPLLYRRPGWKLAGGLILITLAAAAATPALIAMHHPAADQWAGGTGLVVMIVGYFTVQVVRSVVRGRGLYDAEIATLTIGPAGARAEDLAGRTHRWPLAAVSGAAVRDCSGEEYGVCYQVHLTLADGSTRLLFTTADRVVATWLTDAVRAAQRAAGVPTTPRPTG